MEIDKIKYSQNYYRFRKNKELSYKTTSTCYWCNKHYQSSNKLYKVYKKLDHLNYNDYDKCERAICNDCIYIIHLLNNFDRISYFDIHNHISCYIYPHKKWIVNLYTIKNNKGLYIAYDVGYINHYKIPIDTSIFACPYENKQFIVKAIKEYKHYYNGLLHLYFLLKQLLIKDVSMYIGCMIILSCIKNDS